MVSIWTGFYMIQTPIMKELNPICSCVLDIESTWHFFLHCSTFNDDRCTFLSTLNKTDCKLLELTNSSLSQTPLYENTPLFLIKKKTLILNASIEYILFTKKNWRASSLVIFHCNHSILPETFSNILLHRIPILSS